MLNVFKSPKPSHTHPLKDTHYSKSLSKLLTCFLSFRVTLHIRLDLLCKCYISSTFMAHVSPQYIQHNILMVEHMCCTVFFWRTHLLLLEVELVLGTWLRKTWLWPSVASEHLLMKRMRTACFLVTKQIVSGNKVVADLLKIAGDAGQERVMDICNAVVQEDKIPKDLL